MTTNTTAPAGTAAEPTSAQEPYVGPRPFKEADHSVFFGRDREAHELLCRVVSNTEVLLYSPSGAGKTSLVSARLIPLLKAENCEVLSLARVQRPLQKEADAQAIPNLYVFHTLMSWVDKEADPKRLATLSLKDFLGERAHRTDADGAPCPRVVIFDQFEELFTFYPERWPERQGFFEQVREALKKDPLLRVVFSMREDHVAALDPYAAILPSRLRMRFRLERLRRAAALGAITGPLEKWAELTGVERGFADGVAEKLAENLLQIQVITPTGCTSQTGEFVEAVQLQVACQTLWQNLPADVNQITHDHLQAFGDVNQALGRFYERAVSGTVRNLGVKEGDLRRWFTNELITPVGTRAFVYRGTHDTGGMPNEVVDELQNQHHLLRGEFRAGAHWYELSHDRFIKPILESNQQWMTARAGAEQIRQRLEARVEKWISSSSSSGQLLKEGELLEAERWLKSPEARDLSPSEGLGRLMQVSRQALDDQRRAKERELERAHALAELQRQQLEQSHALAEAQRQQLQQSHALAEEQRLRAEDRERAAARQFKWTIALAVVVVFMFIAAFFSVLQMLAARKARDDADNAQADANQQRQTAVAQKQVADSHREIFRFRELVTQAGSAMTADHSLGFRLAAEGVRRGRTMSIPQPGPDSPPDDPLHEDSRRLRDLRDDYLGEAEGVFRQSLAEFGADAVKRGHTARVLVCCFTPDGKKLLTCSTDQTARLWDVATNKVVELRGHTNEVYHAAVSPDGRLVATASLDKTARVWETATGRMVGAPLRHNDFVVSVDFSPDGKEVITGSWDKTACIWVLPSDEERSRLAATATGLFAVPGAANPWSAAGMVYDWSSARLKCEPLQGHTDKLNTVACSPDGKLVVTAGHDGTARVWAAKTGRPTPNPMTFLRHNGRVNWAAFSRDSKYVATASWDNTARVWNAATSTSISEPLAHSARVNWVEFSPNGKSLLTASGDNLARIWQWGTARSAPVVLRGHLGDVLLASFSPDGRLVVTASADATARLWEAATGRLLNELRGHKGRVMYASFSPDGQTVATASDDHTLRLWKVDSATRPEELRGHTARVTGAAFSADGKSLVTVGADQMARLWEPRTGKPPAELRGHTASLTGAAFSPNGSRLVTTSRDQTARLWDPAAGRLVKELIGHTEPVTAAAFSPNGRRVVTVAQDNTYRVWAADTGDLVAGPLTGFTARLGPTSFSPDGKRLVTASAGVVRLRDGAAGAARLWDRATGKVVAELVGHDGPVSAVAHSPDGKFVATAGTDKTVRLWDGGTGKALAVLRGHTAAVSALVFNPDGTRLATEGRDHTARVWEVPTGKLLFTLPGLTGPIAALAFSPDGKRLLTEGGGQTAKLWDATTGQEIAELRGHTAAISAVAFNGKDPYVVTGSRDQTARLWHAETGKFLRELRGHEGPINGVAFSPDGGQVVTASEDRTARVWEAASGKLLARLGSPISMYYALVSADGKLLLTHNGDNAAHLRDLATGQEVAELRGPHGSLDSMAFAAGNKSVITTGRDGMLRVWDARSGKLTNQWAQLIRPGPRSQFSSDGRRTVAISPDNKVVVLETETGKTLAEVTGFKVPPRNAVLSPDGQWVLTGGGDNQMRVWNATSGEPLPTLEKQQGSPVLQTFSPDSKQVVVASRVGTMTEETIVQVWEVATGKLIKELGGYTGTLVSLALSADNKLVIALGTEGKVRLREVSTGKDVPLVPDNVGPVVNLTVSPDGKAVGLVSESTDVWLADLGTRKSTKLERSRTWANYLAFSPDGRVFVEVDHDAVRLWDVGTGQRVAGWEWHNGPVTAVAFTADGKRVLTASGDRTARVWEAATGKSLAVLRGHGGPVSSLALSADGEWAVTAGPDGTARVWDTATGRPVSQLGDHSGPVNGVAFSPGGERIVTASGDLTTFRQGMENKARVWDLGTGQVIRELVGHTGPVNTAVFSHDGKRVVTAGEDGTARVWEADSGREVLNPPIREQSRVTNALFSPDGQLVLTTAGDSAAGTVRLWEAGTGKRVHELRGHSGEVTAVAFSGHGKFLVTASTDGTARVWDVKSGQPLALLPASRGAVTDVALSPDGRSVVLLSDDHTVQVYTCELCGGLDELIALAKRRLKRELDLSPEEQAKYLRGLPGKK